MTFDVREVLRLDGLADARLEGLVTADRYLDPLPLQASAPVTALRLAPKPDATQLDQLLFGERFDVLAERDGWAYGQARRDGYVGWVDAAALSGPPLAPGRRVTALRAYAFAEPDIKSAPVGLYSLNALVTVEAQEGRFVRAARAGWFVEGQLAPVGTGFAHDPVEVAGRFLGAPYLWGGRESLGLDCSGLVQAALHACGRACPRDSDQQRALGRAVDAAQARRGDLLFWRGHVGLLSATDRLLHANAHAMAVADEPLADALARMGPPEAVRRL